MINIFEKNRYGLLGKANKEFFVVDEEQSKFNNFNRYMSILPFEFSSNMLTCDFLIAKDQDWKHKYYGKPVYTEHSIIKYIANRNHNNITSSREHIDLMSMVRGGDYESSYLGITTLVKSLTYNDILYMIYMIKNRIYPYDIFSYRFSKLTTKNNTTNELLVSTLIGIFGNIIGNLEYSISRERAKHEVAGRV